MTSQISSHTPFRSALALVLAAFMLAATGCDSSEDTATTGTITGTIQLPSGASGNVNNIRVALFNDIAGFRTNVATTSVSTDANGSYSFENLNPGSYFLSAWLDNNNNQVIDGGDFFGYQGGGPLDLDQATPQSQTVVAGESYELNFVIQIVPAGFGISLTGTYSGTTTDNESMSLTLTQNGTAVSGSGTVNGPGGAYQLNIGSISGSFNAPNLNLMLTSAQLGTSITMQGTVSDDGRTINATLNGGALPGGGNFYTNATANLTLQQ